MTRLVLAIQAMALPLIIEPQSIAAYPIPDDFFNTPGWMLPKSLAEQDARWLQLIPYVVCFNMAGDKILAYTRGGKGEEARLHAKRSIGVGGHIDLGDCYNMREYLDMLKAARFAAAREIREEIGTSFQGSIEFKSLLMDSSTDVGRVHLGLFAVVRVAEQGLEFEEEVLNGGKFYSLHELLEDVSSFEEYSICLLRMFENSSASTYDQVVML